MNSPKSFKEVKASDSELQSIENRLRELHPERDEEVSRAASFRERISNAALGVRDLAAAMIGGGPRPAAVAVPVMREQLQESETVLAALELATATLEKQREARLAILREAYVVECRAIHHSRLRRIIDNLLGIAEENAAVKAFADEQAGDGIHPSNFMGIQFPVKSSAAAGGWHSEKLHLAALLDHQARATGYVPTPDQRQRLAALAD